MVALRRELERKTLALDAIAHELRSPLAVIRGLADTLRGPARARLSERDREHLLARIASNASRMNATLENLVDAAREEAGGLQARPRRTDLAALVERVLQDLDLAGHPIEVSVALPVARVDGFLLERIVENLVTNAVRHTPPGTRIKVAVKAVEGGVELTVADDGPPVPADLQRSIFERFQQADSAASADGGSGLGLFLVKRFAELHGGDAWVNNDPSAASFHVRVPTAPKR